MFPQFSPVHNVHMAQRVQTRFRQTPKRTFLRDWRKDKQRSLEQAAEYVGITHASLSRIERGLQPYNQGILEGLADYYGTSPASLLERRPDGQDAIWSIWDQAKPGERRQIVEIAKTLLKTGT